MADLWIDKILADRATGGVAFDRATEESLPPGSGPRHRVFSPGGRPCFVVNELMLGVMRFAVTPQTGALTYLAILPLAGFDGNSAQPAGIIFSPNTEVLLVSLRGSNEIVAIQIGAEARRLSVIGRWHSGGKTPRDLALTPSGRHHEIPHPGVIHLAQSGSA